MDARGITDAKLTKDFRRSSMAQLAGSTAWADKVIVFCTAGTMS
jgi:sulfur relay (sulfurtransferase) complex TusBCD TusD component (DsrE family)